MNLRNVASLCPCVTWIELDARGSRPSYDFPILSRLKNAHALGRAIQNRIETPVEMSDGEVWMIIRAHGRRYQLVNYEDRSDIGEVEELIKIPNKTVDNAVGIV